MMQSSAQDSPTDEFDNSNREEEPLRLIPAGNNLSHSSMGSVKKRATKVSSSRGDVSARKKKKLRLKPDENNLATFIKYSALVMLVAQMVGLVLLLRYSRTRQNDQEHPLYLASTAVFFMEGTKLIICLLVLAVQARGQVLTQLRQHVIDSPGEMAKLCIPSLLYTVQNNLLYLALTNLDAATYQVCYQLKILTTALFSALLLQRRFSPTKWLALLVLTLGVVIVQLSGSKDQHDHADTDSMHHRINTESVAGTNNNRFVGLVAVLCAACTSGFAGVYFEKILKGSTTSLWIRNIQMGIPSVFIAYITVYMKDSQEVKKNGFMGGYSNLVWTVIMVQAVGGLIVATVVKYADNVLKVFASSFSIVVSCIISAFLFDFHPTHSFVVGASLVLTATVMYSSPEKRPRRKPVLPMTRTTRM
jgi:UDP-sugar transporter A1/2/3